MYGFGNEIEVVSKGRVSKYLCKGCGEVREVTGRAVNIKK